MTIRLRLTLWYSGILAVTLLLFGIAVYYLLSFFLEENLRRDLREQAEKVGNRIEAVQSLSFFYGLKLDLYLNEADFRSTMYLLQVSNISTGAKSKSLLLEQYGLELPFTETMMKNITDKGESFDKVSLGGLSLVMYSIPLSYRGNVIGILQVAQQGEQLNETMDTLQYIFALAVLAAIAIAATFGWFLARKALQPLEQVIEAANQIERGLDLSRRVDYNGPRDEIGRLTETINGMLSRIQAAYTELEEAYAAQRRFVSDASHELRTPLTTIRGNVDLLEKMWRRYKERTEPGEPDGLDESTFEAMRDIADEAQRMTRLVNDLLSLARADAGLQIEMDELELMPIVEEVARRAQFLPRTAEWRVGKLNALDNVKVWGNKDYLQQMLFIFIENAFKYTEHGHVMLDAVREENQIGLRISDTGIGMDRDEVPRIFDRFYRADPSRGKTSGTGLGLSIAKWIIDAHGGSVEVRTKKGEGSVFLIWLPVYSELPRE